MVQLVEQLNGVGLQLFLILSYKYINVISHEY